MRLLDKTFLTYDEEYLTESRLGELVRTELKALQLDTYNHRYIVRLTVDRQDEPAQPPRDDEDTE